MAEAPMKDVALAYFSFAVAAFFAALAILMSYEGFAFLTGNPPITQHMRGFLRAQPTFAWLIAFGLGALLSHFYWSSK